MENQEMSESEQNEVVYKLMDKVLQKANDFSFFYIRSLLDDEFNEYDFHTTGTLSFRLHTAIQHYGYVTPCNLNTATSLTSIGMEAKKAGGHTKYTALLKEKEEALQAKEKAEYENLIHSTKVNKYLYQTRWLPHVLATAALAVSIWALVESKKPVAPEPKPGKEINTVKDTVINTRQLQKERESIKKEMKRI